MEHVLSAPRDGKIVEVKATLGSQVSAGQILISLEDS